MSNGKFTIQIEMKFVKSCVAVSTRITHQDKLHTYTHTSVSVVIYACRHTNRHTHTHTVYIKATKSLDFYLYCEVKL